MITRRATQPIPSHLVDRFISLAWSIADGDFPASDWARIAGRNRPPVHAQRHAIAALWSVSCALRFSELRRLHVADVSHSGAIVRVTRSKGGASNVVPVPGRLIDATFAWRVTAVSVPSPWLLATPSGGQLTNNAFNRDASQMFASLLGVPITSHSFRDTACQLAVGQGETVFAIQQFMGHRSAHTTEVYLRKRQAGAMRLRAIDPQANEVVA